MLKLLIPAVVFLAACASDAPPKIADESHVWNKLPRGSRLELPSGMTVLLQENHATPVVALQAWVRVGSADEGPEQEGYSHIFEHMLFNATKKRKPGEIAELIEGLGGETSARTTHDHTVFEVVLARRFLDTGLEVLADALDNAAFDADQLKAELGRMKEEQRQLAQQPVRKLSQALFELVFTTNPYRRPVMGTETALDKVQRDQLVKFYEQYFAPQNTVIVIAGDIEPEQAKEAVQKAFKGYNRKPGERAVRAPEPPQTQPRNRTLHDGVSDVFVSCAWPTPGLESADVFAVNLLAVILGQGESSRLQSILKRDKNLALDAYGFAFTPKTNGLFAVGLVASPKNAREASAEMVKQVYRLRSEVVSEVELKRAKSVILSDTFYQQETAQGRAKKAGFFQVATGDAGFEERFHAEIERVTVGDIRRVASRYLKTETLSTAVLVPKTDTFDASSVVAYARTLEPTLKNKTELKLSAPSKSGVFRVKLASGTTVLIQPDRTVPVVAVRAAFVGGQRYEDKSTNGIHQLMARLLPRATRQRNRTEVAALTERIAANIDGFAGQNSFGLYGEFLKGSLGEGLDLMAEMLVAPRFDKDDIDRERTIVLSDIRGREDNPSHLVFDTFAELLYDAHPYRLRARGSVDAVSSLRSDALTSFYQSHYTRDRLVLALVGDVQPEDVLAQLERLLGAPVDKHAVEKPPAAEPPLEKPRAIAKVKERREAYMVLGFRGAAIGDKDRYALELLATILTGQGGRLSKTLKERDKLAFNVASVSIEGLEPGYFATYVATTPDKLDQALAQLRKELYAAAQQPIPEEELERARRYLIGTHAISLQKASARAASMALNELYGLGYDDDAQYEEQVLHVKAEDVMRVAKEYLDLNRSVLAVVRPSVKAK